MNLLCLPLTFAMLSFATCFNFPFCEIRNIVGTCPVGWCMQKKVDLYSIFDDKVVLTNSNGLRFEEGLFNFSCGIFDLFRTCLNNLTLQELPMCIPSAEQKIVFRILPVIDDAVCSKVQRLDKLIPCMNVERVQNFIFEDLRFASYQYIEYFKSNGSLPCSEIKKKYLYTIIMLSMSCDNDGLEALLEILSELRIKLQDLIFTEIMPVGTSPKDFCLDAP